MRCVACVCRSVRWGVNICACRQHNLTYVHAHSIIYYMHTALRNIRACTQHYILHACTQHNLTYVRTQHNYAHACRCRSCYCATTNKKEKKTGFPPQKPTLTSNITHDLCSREVDVEPLSESRGVVVLHRLGIAERLQQRRGLQQLLVHFTH